MEKMNKSLKNLKIKNDNLLLNFKPSIIKLKDKNGKDIEQPIQPLMVDKIKNNIKVSINNFINRF